METGVMNTVALDIPAILLNNTSLRAFLLYLLRVTVQYTIMSKNFDQREEGDFCGLLPWKKDEMRMTLYLKDILSFHSRVICLIREKLFDLKLIVLLFLFNLSPAVTIVLQLPWRSSVYPEITTLAGFLRTDDNFDVEHAMMVGCRCPTMRPGGPELGNVVLMLLLLSILLHLGMVRILLNPLLNLGTLPRQWILCRLKKQHVVILLLTVILLYIGVTFLAVVVVLLRMNLLLYLGLILVILLLAVIPLYMGVAFLVVVVVLLWMNLLLYLGMILLNLQ